MTFIILNIILYLISIPLGFDSRHEATVDIQYNGMSMSVMLLLYNSSVKKHLFGITDISDTKWPNIMFYKNISQKKNPVGWIVACCHGDTQTDWPLIVCIIAVLF